MSGMHITRQNEAVNVRLCEQQKVELTDILRLDICVNEVAFFMKILETEKDLFDDTFDDTRSKTFPAILLDEGKEVFAEWFKGDAYVGCRRDRVGERVEKVDDMRFSRMRR